MRTKTLLIAAAALAVGAVTSMAQTYSQNIVGYVNVATVAGQYVLLGNPLDDGTNKLADLVPSVPVGSLAQVWNGSGYTQCSKTPTSWSPNASVPVGSGFFLRTAAVKTNTFAGNVAATPGGGTVTNTLTGGVYSLVSSGIPFAENLAGTNINLKPAVGSLAQVWNGAGYTQCSKTPTSWSPNPAIGVGIGFFVRPTVTYKWIQTLQ